MEVRIIPISKLSYTQSEESCNSYVIRRAEQLDPILLQYIKVTAQEVFGSYQKLLTKDFLFPFLRKYDQRQLKQYPLFWVMVDLPF